MSQVGSSSYSKIFSTGIDNFQVSSTAVNTIFGSSSIVPANFIPDQTLTNAAGKYSIFDIANWFLLKGTMTHKKLQKLCYYAQAWCYALKDYRLADTDFQAWIHGPISPALFERFKGFGFETICINTNYRPSIEEADLMLLEDVWETYGDRTGNALEALSHRELPWVDARRGYNKTERCSVVISPESMRKYYKSIYNR